MRQTDVLKFLSTLIRDALKTPDSPAFFFTCNGEQLSDSGTLLDHLIATGTAVVQTDAAFIMADLPVEKKTQCLAVNLERLFVNAGKLGDFLSLPEEEDTALNGMMEQLRRHTLSPESRPQKRPLQKTSSVPTLIKLDDFKKVDKIKKCKKAGDKR